MSNSAEQRSAAARAAANLGRQLAANQAFVLVGAGYGIGIQPRSLDFETLAKKAWNAAESHLAKLRQERGWKFALSEDEQTVLKNVPAYKFDRIRLELQELCQHVDHKQLESCFLSVIKRPFKKLAHIWLLENLKDDYTRSLHEGYIPPAYMPCLVTLPRLAREELIHEAVTTNYDDYLEFGSWLTGMVDRSEAGGDLDEASLVSWREEFSSVSDRIAFCELAQSDAIGCSPTFPIAHIHGRLIRLLEWSERPAENALKKRLRSGPFVQPPRPFQTPPTFVITARSLSSWGQREWARHLLLHNLRTKICWLIGVSLGDAVLQQGFEQVLSEAEADAHLDLDDTRPTTKPGRRAGKPSTGKVRYRAKPVSHSRYFLTDRLTGARHKVFLGNDVAQLGCEAGDYRTVYMFSMFFRYLKVFPGWLLNEPLSYNISGLAVSDMQRSLAGWIEENSADKVFRDFADRFYYRFPETVKTNWLLANRCPKFAPSDHMRVTAGIAHQPLYYLPAFKLPTLGLPLLTMELCLLALQWLGRGQGCKCPTIADAKLQPLIPLSCDNTHLLLLPVVSAWVDSSPYSFGEQAREPDLTNVRSGRAGAAAVLYAFPRSRELGAVILARTPVELRLRWDDPLANHSPDAIHGSSQYLREMLNLGSELPQGIDSETRGTTRPPTSDYAALTRPTEALQDQPIDQAAFPLNKAFDWLKDFAYHVAPHAEGGLSNGPIRRSGETLSDDGLDLLKQGLNLFLTRRTSGL